MSPPFRRLAVWLTLAALCCATLPSPPARAAIMSKAEERKIGKKVLGQVRHSSVVLDDPYLEAYLKSIGDTFSKAMGAGEFAMEFYVVADPAINAFAVPGGYIFVTSTTILTSNDESELAGVIAHEMGHVEGRHIAYRAEKAGRVNVATAAAVLAGIFLGSPELAVAATSFALAGAQAKLLQYSRFDEEDADRRAVRALQSSGYDAWGMVRFMETLRKTTPTPDGIPAYLFTHPLPANRTAYLSASLRDAPQVAPQAEQLERLWRAQARVLVGDPRPWGMGLFQERVRDHATSPAAHLGLALLLRKQGQFEEAVAELQQAERLAPGDPEAFHELAATRLRQGRVGEGLALLEALRRDNAAGPAVLRDLGWAYLETERGAEALAVYDQLRETNARWQELPYYRGLALGKAGRAGEGYAELGRYHADK
ncbi:MAG TPA: M48 family metalloprotease, partial [Deferrisomatales bacterium]|nr:M48 family metalloprotease [Deferrisomatales bacterium]